MAYENFFGLKDAPFRLTPDPAYFFPSDVHKEALQTLLYSIRAGEGFVQITGDPGTGKTLILRTILRQLGDEVTTALILDPRLSPQELLRVILEDLGLDPAPMQNQPKEALLRFFRDFLLAKAQKGVKTVVIVDESQTLPKETLEELRLLSNLETDKEKLLQIILVGQVELEEKLLSPDLRQLSQRITIRYRLKPLSKQDTIAYIYHRLSIAGGVEQVRFSPRVLNSIHKFSKGIPRLINILCERSLMAAFVEGKKTIEMTQVKKAIESIMGEEEMIPVRPLMRPVTVMLLALLLIVTVVGLGFLFFPFPGEKRSDHQTEQNIMIAQAENPAFQEKEKIISEKETTLKQKEALLSQKETGLGEKESELSKKETSISEKESDLSKKEVALKERETDLSQKLSTLLKKETELSQKEDSLSSKEDILSKKEELLAKKADTPLRTRATPAPPVKSVLPIEAFTIPKNKFLVAVDCTSGKASLWQGSDGAPVRKAEFACKWLLGEGLFILGKDASGGEFIFHHLSFLWGRSYVMSTDLWAKVSRMVSGNIVPLVAYSPGMEVNSAMIEKAREIKTIVESWAEIWRSRDITRLMGFYGDVFTTYDMSMDKPIVFSKAQLSERKREVMTRSGPISLAISEPLYMIDPDNPKIAIAVFYQQYSSKVYADKGTQVLYFSLVDEPDGKATWKIVAKLWVRM